MGINLLVGALSHLLSAFGPPSSMWEHISINRPRVQFVQLFLQGAFGLILILRTSWIADRVRLPDSVAVSTEVSPREFIRAGIILLGIWYLTYFILTLGMFFVPANPMSWWLYFEPVLTLAIGLLLIFKASTLSRWASVER